MGYLKYRFAILLIFFAILGNFVSDSYRIISAVKKPAPVQKTYSGGECYFPFTYKGRQYSDCTSTDHPRRKLWCILKNRNGSISTVKDLCVRRRNLRITTYGGTGQGADCVFPFSYKHKWYHGCTMAAGENKYWCSTAAHYSTVTKKWGYCNSIDTTENLMVMLNNDVDILQTKCHFPFTYGGESIYGCLGYKKGFWCSTTENYDLDKRWVKCSQLEGRSTVPCYQSFDGEHCTFPYFVNGTVSNTNIHEDGKNYCSVEVDYDKRKRFQTSIGSPTYGCHYTLM